MISRNRKSLLIFVILFMAFALAACNYQGKLIPAPGTELTDKDLQLNAYYQSLKWYNNTIENIMANIALLPQAEQVGWIAKADPIKQAADTSLSGWKMAIDSADYAELNAHRNEFKQLKNSMIDLLASLAAQFG